MRRFAYFLTIYVYPDQERRSPSHPSRDSRPSRSAAIPSRRRRTSQQALAALVAPDLDAARMPKRRTPPSTARPGFPYRPTGSRSPPAATGAASLPTRTPAAPGSRGPGFPASSRCFLRPCARGLVLKKQKNMRIENGKILP